MPEPGNGHDGVAILPKIVRDSQAVRDRAERATREKTAELRASRIAIAPSKPGSSLLADYLLEMHDPANRGEVRGVNMEYYATLADAKDERDAHLLQFEEARNKWHVWVDKGAVWSELPAEGSGRLAPVKVAREGRAEAVTEADVVADMNVFLETVRRLAESRGDLKVKEKVDLFRRNTVFLGHEETEVATNWIAEQIFKAIDTFPNVYIHYLDQGEGRAVVMRAVRVLEQRLGDDPRLNRVKVTSEVEEIAEGFKKNGRYLSTAILVRDSILDGSEVEVEEGQLYLMMVDMGYPSAVADKIINAYALRVGVKRQTREDRFKLPVVLEDNQGLTWQIGPKERELFNLKGYWGVVQYHNRDGWIYGAASTIYEDSFGVLATLENFKAYLARHGQASGDLLWDRLVRPYEVVDGRFKDPDLQKEWEQFSGRYHQVRKTD